MLLNQIKNHPDIQAYIVAADEYLEGVGYTEHRFKHAEIVSDTAKSILESLGYPPRYQELAAVSGYIHDMGNMLGRTNHGISSALLVQPILKELGVPPRDSAIIMSAVANHEEEIGVPTHPVSSALILADKADVRRSRVRDKSQIKFDIHDRVNYAVVSSSVKANKEKQMIIYDLEIDTSISSVAEYFEIFMSRIIIARKSARTLGCSFKLVINGIEML